MGLLKYIPKLMILPTSLATFIGLVRGYIPSFVVWMLVGASFLLVLLVGVSSGTREDGKRFLLWIRDKLDSFQALLFRTVKGKDKSEILRLKEKMVAIGQEAEETKLQGDEDGYLTLRSAARCLGRAATAREKKHPAAAVNYELASGYHQEEYHCHNLASEANHLGHRQIKWLWQAASHNWGNAAHFQAKAAVAFEENIKEQVTHLQKRVEKFKKAADFYQQAAKALAKEDLKLASSLEEKAEEAATKAKQLGK